MKNSFLVSLFTAIALPLFGCGGGGGGGGDTGDNVTPPIGSIAGVWQIDETSKDSNDASCKNLDRFNLTVEQNGNAITVIPSSGDRLNGTLSGNTLTWNGSYSESPGSTTSSVSVQIGSTCNTLSGRAEWTYSETGYSCSGTTIFTGTRTLAAGC